MRLKNGLITTAIAALMFCSSVEANDGVFYVRGNNLIPMQETQVELHKEVLKFYVTDYEWMNVDVDFSFYNPGKSKTVIVGFVTPPAGGDTDEFQHPQIKDFTVNLNGRKVVYKVKRMSETTFSFEKLNLGESDFVYYFPVTFKPGMNRVRHTYKYRGGSYVELQRIFDYQITTGKRWSNKQIDDFEMEVHLDNGIYAVPASFREDGKLADWVIVGDGVIQNRPFGFVSDDGPKVRMAHLNRGYLSFKEKNFRPENDIIFAEFNWAAGWVKRWCDFEQQCKDSEALGNVARFFDLNPLEGTMKAELKELSAYDLQIVRNYFFALRGYEFKSEELRRFFSQFFWYKPDPVLILEDIKLSDAEKRFVNKLMSEEKSRTQ